MSTTILTIAQTVATLTAVGAAAIALRYGQWASKEVRDAVNQRESHRLQHQQLAGRLHCLEDTHAVEHRALLRQEAINAVLAENLHGLQTRYDALVEDNAKLIAEVGEAKLEALVYFGATPEDRLKKALKAVPKAQAVQVALNEFFPPDSTQATN